MAGGWGNTSDISISVALSVMAAAPFNGTDDENLVVGYIAVFMLVWSISISVISFTITIIPPLKALFVAGVPGTHIP
ncbi:hypothetical protein C8R48DRAFT_774588 [Suillus tomentosus]|nr:hypothetical protein C8R48DRAFT_774588 [Suillus tomentosus]